LTSFFGVIVLHFRRLYLYIYICQHIFSNIFIGIVAQSSRLQ